MRPDRGDQPRARRRRRLHILPHLWFRNTWAWGPSPAPRADDHVAGRKARASSRLVTDDSAVEPLARSIPVHYRLGPRTLVRAAAAATLLFTDNETNMPARLRTRQPQPQAARQGRLPPPRHPRRGRASTPQDRHQGRASLPVRRDPAGRLGRPPPAALRLPDLADPLAEVDDRSSRLRRAEADEFYAAIHPAQRRDDERLDPAPGAGRAALDQADLSLRRQRLARRRQPATGPRPRRGERSATSTGGTSTRCG